ncbi:MAG TPA: transcription termination/antitermination NusG family protein [Pyrinomonadaceae bacterium]|jgi:transcriptional antiterminator RfaH|nr:transcription termination/antitermination NusG family protein [Pyrinomonadaceae bacterium]
MSEQPRWYAVRTKQHQEERVHQNLQAWGVESLSPKIRQRRLNAFTGVPVYFPKPLFPRYIFARFELRNLHKIVFTRGVHSVVSFDGGPTAIDDEIITIIKSRVGADGFVSTAEELREGDRVVIKEGPLKDLVGVFERKVKDSDRVMILLTAITFQGRVTVAADWVARASQTPAV